MRNLLLTILCFVVIYSCGKSDKGELVGYDAMKFFNSQPSGMVLIPSGSFLMGMADDDYVQLQNAPVSTVSIKAFYMDETEITNGEYKQFVNWVRDSVVRDALAKRAIAEIGSTPTEEDLDLDNSINSYFPIYEVPEDVSDEEKGGYQLYKEQNLDLEISEFDKSTYNLNYDVDLLWDREDYPDLAYAEVMEGVFPGEGFFLPKEESFNGERTFNTKKIEYTFTVFDAEAAIKSDSDSRKIFSRKKQFQFILTRPLG